MLINSVTPSELHEYKPNSSTLLYMPFTEDKLDHSGKNRNVTSDTGIIQNGFYFNDTADVNKQGFTVADMPALTNFTTTYWEKKTGAYASQTQASFLYSGGNQIHTIDFVTKFRFGIRGWDNDPGVPDNGADVWRLLTFVVNGTNFRFYINGTLIGSAYKSFTQPAGNHYYLGYGSTYLPLMGYASQLIQESIAWSDDEVANYYNQTKGNYGL